MTTADSHGGPAIAIRSRRGNQSVPHDTLQRGLAGLPNLKPRRISAPWRPCSRTFLAGARGPPHDDEHEQREDQKEHIKFAANRSISTCGNNLM